jgi:hypothetical protein
VNEETEEEFTAKVWYGTDLLVDSTVDWDYNDDDPDTITVRLRVPKPKGL